MRTTDLEVATPRPGAPATDGPRWLLLIHQVPAKPDYVRVKVRRRLRRLGAVALKNAVYVLPRADGTTEDFQWLLREIVAEGGDALLVAASVLEGVSDAEVEAMFNRDRDADYAELASAAAQPAGAPAAELARLRRRFDEGSWTVQEELDPYRALGECPACGGARLRAESQSVKE